MKKILHDDYGNRAEIEEVVTLPYKDSPEKKKVIDFHFMRNMITTFYILCRCMKQNTTQ